MAVINTNLLSLKAQQNQGRASNGLSTSLCQNGESSRDNTRFTTRAFASCSRLPIRHQNASLIGPMAGACVCSHMSNSPFQVVSMTVEDYEFVLAELQRLIDDAKALMAKFETVEFDQQLPDEYHALHELYTRAVKAQKRYTHEALDLIESDTSALENFNFN